MKRFLIFLMVVASCLAVAAQEPQTIDGVIYKMRNNVVAYGCTVVGVTDDCPSKLNILASVKFGADDVNVATISQNALQCNNVNEIDIQSAAEGVRNFTIGQYSFSGCTLLENLTLPTDLSRIHGLSFINNTNLSQIILDKTQPPVNSLATLVDVTGVEGYKLRLSKVKLYVPDSSVDLYKNDESKNSSATSDSWPVKGFWSAFDVRPMSELTGDPEPVEKPEGVRVPLENGGSILLLDAVPGHRIQLQPTDASILKSATFNGEDASQYIEGDVFTIPKYTGVAHFIPVFEMATSNINTVSEDKLVVRVMDRSVSVMLDNVPVDVDIYNMSGQKVYGGHGSGISLDSGVYLLKAENRTFKFAL